MDCPPGAENPGKNMECKLIYLGTRAKSAGFQGVHELQHCGQGYLGNRQNQGMEGGQQTKVSGSYLGGTRKLGV